METPVKHKHLRKNSIATYSDYGLHMYASMFKTLCETCYNKVKAEIEKRK